MTRFRALATAIPAAVLVALAAAPAEAAGLDGRQLGLGWSVPFVGLLLSIAILPQLATHFWDRHIGKLSAAWALAAALPLAAVFGVEPTATSIAHTLVGEYVPFVILLFALYTIAGGIVVEGDLRGTPAANAGLLALGTLLASLIGTTGASMVLIRPLIRANAGRRHVTHIVVFFVFLVSNVGGALTPLGDPPLFLGFLRGVDFFWTTRALFAPTAFTVVLLLAIFYGLDRFWYARDDRDPPRPDPTPPSRLRLTGRWNLALLAGLVGLILLSGLWRSDLGLSVAGTRIALPNAVRDAGLVLLALASLAVTRRTNRIANAFSWRPIVEVGIIFLGIFVTIAPVAAALQAGPEGAFAPLLALVSRPDGSPNPIAYFWLTGLLSSVLDNAPTYLVFFDLAGGDAARLMGPLAHTLAAISTGAVFMGALTYLGNAPNFMVYAIARQSGVRMPGFVGYMAWSGAILLPVFGLVSWLFFA